MSIKNLIQTRWTITPGRVVIYPYGIVYLIGIFIALASIGWTFFLVHILSDMPDAPSFLSLWPVWSLYSLVVIIICLFAGTRIAFDQHKSVMYKLLFGFLKTKTLPFQQIAAIIPVRNFKGTFQYQVVPQNISMWNTGTIISSAVGSEHSPHALAFQKEVLSVISSYIK